MKSMFSEAYKFNQDLSSWNIQNVTNCAGFSGFTYDWILPQPNFLISCD